VQNRPALALQNRTWKPQRDHFLGDKEAIPKETIVRSQIWPVEIPSRRAQVAFSSAV